MPSRVIFFTMSTASGDTWTARPASCAIVFFHVTQNQRIESMEIFLKLLFAGLMLYAAWLCPFLWPSLAFALCAAMAVLAL